MGRRKNIDNILSICKKKKIQYSQYFIFDILSLIFYLSYFIFDFDFIYFTKIRKYIDPLLDPF